MKKLFVPILLAGIGLIPACPLSAQVFTTLHHFTGSEGANPEGGLILSSNIFYGVTYGGGTVQSGIVFAVNTDGTDFTNLHIFGLTNDTYGPVGSLTLSGNTLYGGTLGGTLFAVKTDGTGFRILSGVLSDGNDILTYGSLAVSGNILYGAIPGAIFAIHTNGTGYTNIYSFGKNDGSRPKGGLLLSGGTLFGTTSFDGQFGNGTVFKMNTNGSGFTVLHAFTGLNTGFGVTNSDGCNPSAGLILSGNTLYGAGYLGGTFNCGTVFAVDTDGTGFTNLHNFEGNDGMGPSATLVLSGRTLYGTTLLGGPSNSGTVFCVNTDGSGFAVLHAFTALSYVSFGTNSDGKNPFYCNLTVLGNKLFGMTEFGGNTGYGTVYSISLTPQLAITASDTNVILKWPTNVGGFDYSGLKLQASTSPGSAAEWSTVVPPPMSVNGTNAVTNAISQTQMFYRLSQ